MMEDGGWKRNGVEGLDEVSVKVAPSLETPLFSGSPVLCRKLGKSCINSASSSRVLPGLKLSVCPQHSAQTWSQCTLSTGRCSFSHSRPFIYKVGQWCDLCPPTSLGSQKKVSVHFVINPQGLWAAGWGRGLAGTLVAREACALRAGSWPCAPALDLLFVFLNHTAPWVKGVQPTILQCV